MKNLVLVVSLIITCNFLTNPVNAQIATEEAKSDLVHIPDLRKHSISFCPGGVAFGIYSANYEYLLNSKHGLVIRGDYEMVPKTYSDANIESFGYSLTINYRYHFTEKMKSPFVGFYTRNRVYKGEGKQENTPFEFSRSDWSYGAITGKKWVWKSGLNLTFALGYGFSVDKRDVNNSTPLIESAIDEFENKYDFMSPFIGELSIGYTF